MKKSLLLAMVSLLLVLGLTSCGLSDIMNQLVYGKTVTEPTELDSGSLSYTVNSDQKTCTITHLLEKNYANIILPAELDGYIVTAIGNSVFASDDILAA